VCVIFHHKVKETINGFAQSVLVPCWGQRKATEAKIILSLALVLASHLLPSSFLGFMSRSMLLLTSHLFQEQGEPQTVLLHGK